MAFLTACRKARAWQRHLRALSPFNSLQCDQNVASIAWPQVQRFYTTATSQLAEAAMAAADVQPAASAPEKKRRPSKRNKLDEKDLLDSANRIFNMTLNVENDLLDSDGNEAADADSTSSSAEAQPVVPSEVLEEHQDRMTALDKKREKKPLYSGETLESWFIKHKQDLQPFLNFLHSHGVDQTRTVADLFSAGYWGRLVMLPPEGNTATKDKPTTTSTTNYDDDSETTNQSQQRKEQELLPFEKMFSDWVDVLKKEDIYMTAEDILARWPLMLTRPPFKIGTILAILRAALPDDGTVDVQELIEKAPRILGMSPLEMQNKLLKLQMASEGELQRMISHVPALLTLPLDDVFGNLRLIREHSRSAREFKSFLHTSPSAIARKPRFLQKKATLIRQTLERTLPPGVDAFEMIKAKPQLLLVRGAWLAQRWEAIEDAVELIDEWKEEFSNLISNACAMPSSKDTTSIFPALFERVGDGTDEIPAPPPPEWLHKNMDPHSLGINMEQQQQKSNDDVAEPEKEIWQLDGSGEKEESVDHDEDASDDDSALLKGRKAYSALGEALWMRPWRIQRLEYMAEQVPEEASRVSFVSAMAVTLEQFEDRYPEFNEWMKMKQDPGEYR